MTSLLEQVWPALQKAVVLNRHNGRGLSADDTFRPESGLHRLRFRAKAPGDFGNIGDALVIGREQGIVRLPSEET